MQNWQTPSGATQAGLGPVQTGNGTMALVFRDPLDAARAQQGVRVPAAEYPDGYLGTLNSRRADRLLDQATNRLTQRSYQRGVHKGERVDPADYFWPSTYGPSSRLAAQAGAQLDPANGSAFLVPRAAPLMTMQEHLLADGGRQIVRGSQSLLGVQAAPSTAALQSLRPGWS